MRPIISYTVIPELWFIFNKVAQISPSGEGGFNLAMMESYLNLSNHSGMWTSREFWTAMTYFLKRSNENLVSKRAHRRAVEESKRQVGGY